MTEHWHPIFRFVLTEAPEWCLVALYWLWSRMCEWRDASAFDHNLLRRHTEGNMTARARVEGERFGFGHGHTKLHRSDRIIARWSPRPVKSHNKNSENVRIYLARWWGLGAKREIGTFGGEDQVEWMWMSQCRNHGGEIVGWTLDWIPVEDGGFRLMMSLRLYCETDGAKKAIEGLRAMQNDNFVRIRRRTAIGKGDPAENRIPPVDYSKWIVEPPSDLLSKIPKKMSVRQRLWRYICRR